MYLDLSSRDASDTEILKRPSRDKKRATLFRSKTDAIENRVELLTRNSEKNKNEKILVFASFFSPIYLH